MSFNWVKDTKEEEISFMINNWVGLDWIVNENTLIYSTQPQKQAHHTNADDNVCY